MDGCPIKLSKRQFQTPFQQDFRIQTECEIETLYFIFESQLLEHYK